MTLEKWSNKPCRAVNESFHFLGKEASLTGGFQADSLYVLKVKVRNNEKYKLEEKLVSFLTHLSKVPRASTALSLKLSCNDQMSYTLTAQYLYIHAVQCGNPLP